MVRDLRVPRLGDPDLRGRQECSNEGKSWSRSICTALEAAALIFLGCGRSNRERPAIYFWTALSLISSPVLADGFHSLCSQEPSPSASGVELQTQTRKLQITSRR